MLVQARLDVDPLAALGVLRDHGLTLQVAGTAEPVLGGIGCDVAFALAYVILDGIAVHLFPVVADADAGDPPVRPGKSAVFHRDPFPDPSGAAWSGDPEF